MMRWHKATAKPSDARCRRTEVTAVSNCIAFSRIDSPDPCTLRHTRSSIAGMSTPSTLRPVTTTTLPAPVGPYSPGIVAGHLVFVSGQAGRDPETGLVAADVEAQTEQALRNVAAILEAAGSDLAHVVRCGVFLVDMSEFQQMNAVYARVFGSHRPARTTVEVSDLPGPGLRVEIDAVAVVRT
jgi:2-iminobutanoate/2-iminopropanoate deaminase